MNAAELLEQQAKASVYYAVALELENCKTEEDIRMLREKYIAEANALSRNSSNKQ